MFLSLRVSLPRDHSDRTVEPFRIVVVDLTMNGFNQFIKGPEAMDIPQFLLEPSVPRFLMGIFPRRCFLALAGQYAMGQKPGTTACAIILTALIRVEYLRRRTIPLGIFQGINNELGAMVGANLPANHFTGEAIEHRGQEDTRPIEVNLREIANPYNRWSKRADSFDPIGDAGGGFSLILGLSEAFPASTGLEPILAHNPSDELGVSVHGQGDAAMTIVWMFPHYCQHLVKEHFIFLTLPRLQVQGTSGNAELLRQGTFGQPW